MANLIKNFDFVIPLGYVCNVTSFIMQMHKRDAAYVFDRAGSAMWAISELINNNFEDFLNIDNIVPMKMYENSDKLTLTDKKYYFRLALPQNASKDEILKHNTDKMKHKDRFMSLINKTANDKTVLFIRFEEPSITEEGKRLVYFDYENKYKFDELFYLKEFSDCLKKKNPLLNFKILFIHRNVLGNFVINDKNIIGIVMIDNCDYKDPFVSKKVVETLNFHEEFLLNHLSCQL